MIGDDRAVVLHSGTNSYTRDIDEANRRIKAGQRQSWCGICGRWRWPDEKCCDSTRLSKRAFDKLVRDTAKYAIHISKEPADGQ